MRCIHHRSDLGAEIERVHRMFKIMPIAMNCLSSLIPLTRFGNIRDPLTGRMLELNISGEVNISVSSMFIERQPQPAVAREHPSFRKRIARSCLEHFFSL